MIKIHTLRREGSTTVATWLGFEFVQPSCSLEAVGSSIFEAVLFLIGQVLSPPLLFVETTLLH